MITQDQPFTSAVGALDGQLEADQEKPVRGRTGSGVVNQRVQTSPALDHRTDCARRLLRVGRIPKNEIKCPDFRLMSAAVPDGDRYDHRSRAKT